MQRGFRIARLAIPVLAWGWIPAVVAQDCPGPPAPAGDPGIVLVPPEPAQAPASPKARVVSIKPGDLVEFDHMKEPVRRLVTEALKLTELGLAYRYGSNSRENRGMDCSGTVQCTLKAAGVPGVPRSSHTIYSWARKAGTLRRVSGVHSHADDALDELRPGDLLFWEGTYETAERNPPISHVMIYLGTLKSDRKPVMFGASSGRRFRGKRIHGVSVFDFSLPKAASKSKFVAFGRVPGLLR